MATRVISEEEAKTLIMATIQYDGTATKKEATATVEWADNIRSDQALLELVLSSQVAVKIIDGEPHFRSLERDTDDADKDV